MIEKWQEIKDWPGYLISNTGKVKNGEKVVALCPNKNRRNYHYVYHHQRTMRPRALSVHRLVAKYFIPNPQQKPCVNHIDNNTENNNVLNLEWVTHKENTAHCIKQGRQNYKIGSACSVAKLDEKTVAEIKNLKGKMRYVDIAAKYNTNYSNIAHIMRGSRWSHVNVS